MVAVPESNRLAALENEVRRLRRGIKRLTLLMDVMREAWCLPPLSELRLERKALAEANERPGFPKEAARPRRTPFEREDEKTSRPDDDAPPRRALEPKRLSFGGRSGGQG